MRRRSNLYFLYLLTLLSALSLNVSAQYGDIPELMYFKFNSLTSSTTPNDAPPATRAGNAAASVGGFTVGGTGQFGNALQGGAGGNSNTTYYVNPGWTGTHTGSWTISMWMNAPTPPTTRYYFGNSTGNGLFRCFIGGAASEIRLTGGVPSITLDMPAWTPGISVVTYVYDQTAGTVSGYINGVFQASVTPGPSYPLVGANFLVGSQGVSIGGDMDEFRMYNRALTAAEIADTWDQMLPLTKVPDDAGATVLLEPDLLICAGNHDVRARVQNFGSNVITGLTVNWSLNGVNQTPVILSTTLDTLNGTGISYADVFLGNRAINETTTLKVWTSEPNNRQDTVNTNDTLERIIYISMSGNYTINSTQPTLGTNYNSITEFVEDLNTRGVCGPVIADVIPNTGPYNGKMAFSGVQGTSAVNTVRINGNGNDVVVTTSASNGQREMLLFDATSYVTVDSLNFSTTGAAGWAALITTGSEFDSITNCVFDLSNITSTASASNSGIIISGSNSSATGSGVAGNNIYIKGNHLIGSPAAGGLYYAYSIAGGGNNNNIFEDNLVENYYYYGTYIAVSENNIIRNNEYRRADKTTGFTTNYGIHLVSGASGGHIITGNRIHSNAAPSASNTSSSYGISTLADPPTSNPVIISNNAVYNFRGGIVYGIYVSTGPNTLIYHNTVDLSMPTGSSSANYGLYLTGTNTGTLVKNNNVSITDGTTGTTYGFYYNTAASITDAQKNNFYVNSSTAATQYYGYYAAAYPTQAAFQAAHPTREVGSPAEDPWYLDPLNGDFTPLAINLGTGEDLSLAVPVDINGFSRPSQPTIGAFENTIQKASNDLGVTHLVNPTEVCGGLYDIEVNVRNFGKNIVTSAEVHWSVNDVLQTPLTILNMSLDTFGAANPFDTVVTLGSYNFTSQPLTFKIWTSQPNNQPDTANLNDTLTIILHPALSGSYTINSNLPTSGTNYNTIVEFVDDLNNRGVCGPVVADVEPGSGPYAGKMEFGIIPGVSNINTVRLNGNGNNVTVATAAVNGQREMMLFSGTRYVTVDSLNFSTTGSAAWAVLITNGSEYDSITNCFFDLSNITATASASNSGIVISGSNSSAIGAGIAGNHIYIKGNHLLGSPNAGGMYYSFSIASGGNDSNIFEKNLIENYYYYGTYIAASENNTVRDNDYTRRNKTTGFTTNYGIYLATSSASRGHLVTGNRIYNNAASSATNTSTTYGIGILADPPASDPIVVSNNAVYNFRGGTMYGIYVSTATNVLIYHNTVDFSLPTGSSSTNYGIYLTGTNTGTVVKNNNVSITDGTTGTTYGFYYNTAASVDDVQKNNFYVNSSTAATQNYGYYTTAYATQAAFQAAYPTLEVGSPADEPQYLNPAAGDFTPINPAVLMQGEDLRTVVAVDIKGSTRPSSPTPGAWDLAPEDYNNAGVTALLTPGSVFCASNAPVSVEIRNFGINNIDTVQVHWTVNGVPQSPVTHTVRIDGRMTSSSNTANISLGQLLMLYGQSYELKIWTAMPNNTMDEYNQDDTLTVTLTPASGLTVDLGNDTTICENQSLTLVAGPNNAGFSYMWDNLETSGSRTVDASGTYHVIKTETATGCVGADTLVVATIPAPSVDLGPDTAICEGMSVTLDVGAVNYTNDIRWDDNTTGTTRVVNDEGEYSVTVTAPNGCSSEDIINITFRDEPFVDGLNIILMLDGSYNFALRNPQYVMDAIWDFGDGSPRDTGLYVNHKYTGNGFYRVTVYLIGECGITETLKSYDETLDVFDANSIPDVAGPEVKLYPNPARDVLTIEAPGVAVREIQVYNVLGQQAEIKTSASGSSVVQLDTAPLTPGMYHVVIITDKGKVTRKVEILK